MQTLNNPTKYKLNSITQEDLYRFSLDVTSFENSGGVVDSLALAVPVQGQLVELKLNSSSNSFNYDLYQAVGMTAPDKIIPPGNVTVNPSFTFPMVYYVNKEGAGYIYLVIKNKDATNKVGVLQVDLVIRPL